MSIDLIVTLWTDGDGNDRFMVQHPVTVDELVDVTDQFELVVTATDDGRTGFMVVKKQPQTPEPVHCLDGPDITEENP